MADIPALVDMGRAFHEAKQDRYEFYVDDCAAFFEGLIGNPGAVVFITKGGFICGAIAPAPTNNQFLSAFELFWWATDKSGLKLRVALEEWAAEMGCAEVIFSHPVSEAVVNKILLRAGYEPETAALRKAI
jgi:hypothetical protein